MKREKTKQEIYSYYASKYLSKFTDTRSLAKLEKLIEEDNDQRLNFVASGYVYYAKRDKLSKIKHPKLYEYVKQFEDEKDSSFVKNEYRKVQDAIENYSNSKNVDIQIKEEARLKIYNFISLDKISLNQLSILTDIKYSNIHNFVFNKDYKQISINKVSGIITTLKKIEAEYEIN